MDNVSLRSEVSVSCYWWDASERGIVPDKSLIARHPPPLVRFEILSKVLVWDSILLAIAFQILFQLNYIDRETLERFIQPIAGRLVDYLKQNKLDKVKDNRGLLPSKACG